MIEDEEVLEPNDSTQMAQLVRATRGRGQGGMEGGGEGGTDGRMEGASHCTELTCTTDCVRVCKWLN